MRPCGATRLTGVISSGGLQFPDVGEMGVGVECSRGMVGGPYALSRHPLYLAEGVATVGLVMPGLGLWGLPVVVAYFAAQYLRIVAEERVLVRAFGTDYTDYAERVPRYLPGLRLGE